MGYRVVIAGATGNVGREMLNILAERQFPADEVVALASRRSLGWERHGNLLRERMTTKRLKTGASRSGVGFAIYAS